MRCDQLILFACVLGHTVGDPNLSQTKKLDFRYYFILVAKQMTWESLISNNEKILQ